MSTCNIVLSIPSPYKHLFVYIYSVSYTHLGFANAIVSPALEYKTEGYITGVAAKMFIIAGPVIVYGIVSSTILGLIRYLIGVWA